MSILQSIKPVHCENIAAGIKTREVRKTRPKCELPVKVYIYCTIGPKFPNGFGGVSEALKQPLWRLRNGVVVNYLDVETMDIFQREKLNGKVIGEYVCDEIIELEYDELEQCYMFKDCYAGYILDEILSDTCLSYDEIRKYGGDKTLYLWHISDLRIYDKPKELSEFGRYCPDTANCINCDWYFTGSMYEPPNCGCCGLKPLTRPPQSWCYVEEV